MKISLVDDGRGANIENVSSSVGISTTKPQYSKHATCFPTTTVYLGLSYSFTFPEIKSVKSFTQARFDSKLELFANLWVQHQGVSCCRTPKMVGYAFGSLEIQPLKRVPGVSMTL